MASVFREVVIDSRDPAALGRFCADVLAWPLTEKDDGQEPGPHRRHPSGCDQPEELERLLAFGARPVDVRQGEVPWVVLADPEDNEFCLLGRRVDPT